MQAPPRWAPPTGVLGQIVAEAEVRATRLGARAADLERLAAGAQRPPAFAAALRGPKIAVIAEIKRRSPSKGWIKSGIAAADQARAYEHGGAAAMSVLTEPEHFGGSASDLETVRGAVRIPVLKKDFHVHPVQLVEARSLGASAALLIARALSPERFAEMLETARRLELETLVEVRDEVELGRALDAGATVVGINNRNLETLAIDSGTAERLLRLVPAGVVAIAESGMNARADVERAAQCGADAVLIGSAISAAVDPAAVVRSLTDIDRVGR